MLALSAVLRRCRLFDIDLGAAYGVADDLLTLPDVLADHHLLDHPGLLRDDRLLMSFLDLDVGLAEGGLRFGAADGPVHRSPLDSDLLVAEADGLLDRPFVDSGVDAHRAP